MTELRFDEEATKRLLAVYVTPDVVAQREQFVAVLAPRAGERVLDVGSGPGFVVERIGELVGASGAVCGIDISDPLLSVAREHCAHQQWVEFRHANATDLPFPDGSFDAVISTQVLEYVPDVDTALSEIHRVVRPGGRVVLVGTDWDSIVWASPDRELMERVLEAWEQHATDPRLPRTLSNRLIRAGLELESQRVLPLFNPSFDPNSYSVRAIDLIASFVTGRNGIEREEAESWAETLRHAGERGEYFFSLNRYLFLARRRR
jgi:arsenite methyltransferase